jgi:hypothetical protein
MEISGLTSWLVGEQVDLVITSFIVVDGETVLIVEFDDLRIEVLVSTTGKLLDGESTYWAVDSL